ncbi:hypothetical protein BWI96_09625 [Siphonobacter sp. SORGH_AS_0500]|nr:hypothetical protein BWI96_09625 [Siphonobacter sp. SORGH_AS_0500]
MVVRMNHFPSISFLKDKISAKIIIIRGSNERTYSKALMLGVIEDLSIGKPVTLIIRNFTA